MRDIKLMQGMKTKVRLVQVFKTKMHNASLSLIKVKSCFPTTKIMQILNLHKFWNVLFLLSATQGKT